MYNSFFPENRAAYDNVEKHGTARQTTDDNIMLRRKIAFSVPSNYGKNTDAHSECLTLNASKLIQFDLVKRFTAT